MTHPQLNSGIKLVIEMRIDSPDDLGAAFFLQLENGQVCVASLNPPRIRHPLLFAPPPAILMPVVLFILGPLLFCSTPGLPRTKPSVKRVRAAHRTPWRSPQDCHFHTQ